MEHYRETGRTVRELCCGTDHFGCECYADGLPRMLPLYIEDIPDPPQEVVVLCNPCRTRGVDDGDFTIATAGVDPQGPPGPVSAL